MALIAWERHTHNQERRDLLNRLMARDLTDYAANRPRIEDPPPQNPHHLRRHNPLANQQARLSGRATDRNPMLEPEDTE